MFCLPRRLDPGESVLGTWRNPGSPKEDSWGERMQMERDGSEGSEDSNEEALGGYEKYLLVA